MKPKISSLIIFLMISHIISDMNSSKKISFALKIAPNKKSKEKNISRKLQETNYVTMIFDDEFNTGDDWLTDLSSKISKVSMGSTVIEISDFITNYASFTFMPNEEFKIFFNTQLTSLAYFLSYNTCEDYECSLDETLKSHIISIDFSNLDTSQVTSVSKLFSGCTLLEHINFGNFDTSKIKDISGMFLNCQKLKSIDLSLFDTSQVTTMRDLFDYCYELEYINISHFITTEVTDMKNMFYGCHKLTSIDLSHFDTSLVTDMSSMFSECTNLKILNISNFNTNLVDSNHMIYMFYDSPSLEILDISNLFLLKLCNAETIFNSDHIHYIKYININNIIKYNDDELENLPEYNGLISFNWYSYIYLDEPYLIVCQDGNYITTYNTHYICCSFNTEKKICESDNYITIKYEQTCFYLAGFGNEFRKNISFIKYNNETIGVTSNLHLLDGKLDIEIYFEPIVTDMEKFFADIDGNTVYIVSIDFSHFDSSFVTNMGSMFSGCDSLKSLNFENINTSNVMSMSNMFEFCTSLESLDLSNFDLSKLENMSKMFYNCILLMSIDFSNYKTISLKNIDSVFENCYDLESINLLFFDTSKVESMNSLFSNCYNIREINISHFDTSLVKYMDNMFYNCYSLEILDISNFNMLQIISANDMLTGLSNLNYINLYNIQDNNGIISQSSLNNDNTRYVPFYVCQRENIITNSLSLTCCEYYLNEAHCDNEDIPSPEIDDNINNENMDINIISINDTDIPDISNFINDLYNEIIANMSDIEFTIIQSNIFNLEYSNYKQQLNNKLLKDISTINLGQCEEKLRQQENLDPSEEFIIIKLDIKNKTINATYVQYEIYNPSTYQKVSLNICQNISIEIYTPVEIDEDKLKLISNLKDNGYDIFNIRDQFYNDICHTYTSLNGVDMPLSSRKNLIYDPMKDIYLCQSGCQFSNFNIETNKAKCNCKVQDNFIKDITNIHFDKSELIDSFYDTLYNSNFRILKCFKLLFSIEGIKNNYCLYIMSGLFGFFIIFIVVYVIKGRNKIINIISNIAESKIDKNITNEEKIKETNNFENNPKNTKQKINNMDNLQAPVKRKYKSKNKNTEKINVLNVGENDFDTKEVVNKEMKEIKEKNNEINKDKNENELDKINKIKEEYKDLKDEELNDLEYEIAVIIDKRTFCQYYYSLLKKNQLIIFTFINIDDYNLISIKILLFIVSTSLFFSINAFFFYDETMNKIYDDNGSFNFIIQLPQIIYSSIISSIIKIILYKLSISENQILDLKKEKDLDKFKEKANKIKKNIKIKLIIFLVLSTILMIFYWYFISCFGAAYKNTQLILIKDVLISFTTSMLYTFLFKLFPSIFRIPSLRSPNKDQKYLYKISKILNMI